MRRLCGSNRAAGWSSGRHGNLVTAALLLGIVTAGCSGVETVSREADRYSLAQLQEDFDRYVGLIHRDHPMTFTDKPALERTISAQRELLQDGMSEAEFYRTISPVGSAVRCGHTRTFLSEAGQDRFDEHGRVLPLEIRLVSDELYVLEDLTPDESIPSGSRILSIDEHPATEIIEHMRASLPADGTNITYKDYRINLSFARLFTLLFDGGLHFDLELLEPGSEKPVRRTVTATSPDRRDSLERKSDPTATDCERLCTTIFDDSSYAVLTIKDFGYYDNLPAFRKPVGEFFARLESDAVGALILDVRGNDGGDPYCSAFVASHLIAEPLRYFAAGTPAYNDLVRLEPAPPNVFTGELFVLTDGWCFSSTGHMLSLLRYHERGLFIGEESGGATLCNDASKMHVLEQTGLRLNLPRYAFGTSAQCLPKGHGIPPDVEARPTIHDLIAGRDVALEQAISLVSASTDALAAFRGKTNSE